MIASYLDSTNLKPDARLSDIRMLCQEAAAFNMAAVCINPAYLYEAGELLAGSGVHLCTVIGFPLGAGFSSIKIREAFEAVKSGAGELDMVINIGALKDGRSALVREEIDGVLTLRQDFPFLLKVIVETALLSEDEIARVTGLVSETSADFIKTSTGLAGRGASIRDLEIIKQNRRPDLRIKASGGIKDLYWAMQLIEAGAERIGTSSAGSIMEQYQARDKS